MKVKSVFVTLVAALCIGSITYSAINQKETKPLSAEAYNDKTSVQNGLFVKVTDVNSIQSGEDLLLVGDDVHTFQHHIGVSYHYWLTTEYGGVTRTLDNRNAVYCDNAKGELVTFIRDVDNVFYMKLKHYVDYAFNRGSIKNGYIVQEAYNNNGVTAFGDLFIRSKQNKPSKAAATWELNYNQSGTMQITSKLNNRPLFWKVGNNYNWSSFACSTNTSLRSNVNLYRKVSPSEISIAITNMPTKTAYLPGEAVDLSGLEIRAQYPYSGDPLVTVNSSYNGDTSLFSSAYVSYSEKVVRFKWCGVEWAFNITTEHDRSNEILFLKPDTKLLDLRGTYLIGADIQPGGPSGWIFTVVLDTSSISRGEAGDADLVALNSGTAAVNGVENPISSYYYDSINPSLDKERANVMNNRVEIVCKPNASESYVDYSIKIGNKLLFIEDQPPEGFNGNDKSTWGNFGKLKLADVDYAATANTVKVDEQNHLIVGSGIERQLVVDYSLADEDHAVGRITTAISGELTEDQVPLCLYKLQLSDRLNHYQELSDFKDEFLSDTQSFDPTGANRDIDVTLIKWGSIETSFANLSLDAQSYIASLTYTHNQVAANSFELLADRYDSILNTHYDIEGGFKDFMRRGLSGTYQAKRQVTLEYYNCTINGGDKAEFKSPYNATIVPVKYYACPDTIEILMGGAELADSKYDYDPATGQISIHKNVITDVIHISADAKYAPVAVYYVGVDSNGDELVLTSESIVDDKHTLLTYEAAGFTDAPVGRQFKCWLVNGVKCEPGTVIDVTDNVQVTAYFESTDPVINTLEEKTSTEPYLSYDYNKLGENNYEFSNVYIRFRTIISQSLWNELDGDNDNIIGYGALLTTEEFLAGADLKSFVNNVIGPDGEPTSGIDGTNVKQFEKRGTTPTLLLAANYDALSEDSYSWNLRKTIPLTNTGLTTRYAVVAYILTKDNGVIFVNQAIASVQSIAQDAIDRHEYDDSYRDGSLSYLAGLVA